MSKRLRLLIFVISVCILLLTITATCLAYDTYGPVGNITLNGITYYDIYNGATTSRSDLTNQVQFLRDVVTNDGNLNRWLVLGHEVLKQSGDTENLENYVSDCQTNLLYTDSLKAADTAVRADITDPYKGIGWSDINGIPGWQDADSTQPVFYAFSGKHDSSAADRWYHYHGIAFYDFHLSLLSDPSLQYHSAADSYGSIQAAAADKAPGVTYEDETGAGEGLVGGVANYSAEPVTASQDLSDTTSETITNSIQKSESYSFSEMIGMSAEWQAGLPLLGSTKMTLTLQFTAQQAYSTAYTTEHSVSDSKTETYSVQVVLPAHTKIIMKQSDGHTKVTLSYDSPVAIQYKVAMFDLHGHLYDDNIATHNIYSTSAQVYTFGKSDVDNAYAVANLTNRISMYQSVPGFEASSDGDGLDWNAIYFNPQDTDAWAAHNAVDWLMGNVPMSVTGASISADYKSVGSEINDLKPMYPLNHVGSSTDELKMNAGDYLFVGNLPVQGYDASNVPYYGFDSSYGHWTLLDSAGNPIGNSNNVASLVTDPVSGKIRIVAGDTAGMVYLKYVIDEDKYSTADSLSLMATNASLSSTAVIPVEVSTSSFGGSVGLTGSVTGCVGDPAINLDTLSTLDVAVFDSTGKEIVHPVTWEVQELPSRGITLSGDLVTLSKTGTFHVRARAGNKYSNWVQVSSQAARKLSSVVIADDTDPATLAAQDLKNGDAVVDLSHLSVTALDQYGSPWADVSGLAWHYAPAAGETITGTSLDASQTGAYTVTAAIGTVVSNGLQLTVVDTRPPAAPSNPSALLQAGPSVLLSFTDNATDETGFVVQRQDGGGSFTQIATPGANSGTGTVSFSDTNVVAGHTYTYQVAASKNGVLSTWSGTASATVLTAPAAPSAMTATATSGTTVALSFLDNSSNETGFIIQRNDNNAGWVQLHTPAAAAGTGTTVTDNDTTAVPGHTYQYRVAAVNGFVLSDWSNVATVTIVTPAAAPTSLKASLGRGLQVLLSWQDNATNETGFTIERADNGGAFGQIGTLGALKKTGKVTFTDSTVLPGHTYSYRVAAMLGTELSPYSGTAGAVVPAVPAAPSNVTVSVIRNGASDRVTLHWTRNSTNNTGFVIQRCTTPGFLYELSTFIVGSASATSFTQTTNRHVAYYYRVAAVGSTGWSDWVNATPFPIATP